ncbi:MAG TPA: hypothetical protein VF714_05855 [Jatrophihabitans sp.]
MEKRGRPAAGIAVLVLALTACAGRATGPVDVAASGHPSGSASRIFDEQEKANRKQAEDEVRRLFGLVQIPPGAVALHSAPAALLGPGTPNESTYVSQTRSWWVPMSFEALDDYVRHHPPAGLTAEASNSGFEGNEIIQSYAWWGQVRGSSQGRQLSIQVAPVMGGPDASYLRVDAGSEWLDPHPLRDSTGGSRLRLETGQSCPVRDRGFGGVRNDGADDLDGALAPNGTATSGRVCVYAEGNGGAFALLRQRVLARAEAARVAAAARAVELAHRNGSMIHCPAMLGLTIVVVLTYPSRPAVNLLVSTGGCPTASNGHLIASQSRSLAALVDLLTR